MTNPHPRSGQLPGRIAAKSRIEPMAPPNTATSSPLATAFWLPAVAVTHPYRDT